MAYFDVVDTLQLAPSLSQEQLINALKKIHIESRKINDEQIEFQVPLFEAMTRGYALQGASFGIVTFEKTKDYFTIHYKISISPIRLFVILLPVAAFIMSIIIFNSDPKVSPLIIFLFPMVASLLSCLGYFLGMVIVSWEFREFIRSIVKPQSI
jgi:hypothetical protein